MTAIKLDLNAIVKPEGRFEGDVTAAGPSEYVFSGTLVVRPPLGKADAVFVVRLGHGGNTGAYSYLEYTLNGAGELSFPVSGKGQRKPDENVDFRLGFKEGLNGQFVDENKSTYRLSTDVAEPDMSISSHGELMELYSAHPAYPKTIE